MIKRCNFCLIFIYLISLSARGQIKGVVTDESNNAPIEYATIILKKGGEILDGTISKPDGSFLFLVIPKGCCLGKPYLSPDQEESKNRRKCSPTIK